MATTNVTFAVDDKALATAKAYAAEHGTTLNKLVSAFFGGMADARPRPPLSEAQRVCVEYSLGRVTLSEATERLWLQDAGHFLALMRHSGFPLPRLSEDDAERQAEATYDAVREAFGLEPERKARKPRKRAPR
ncbi:MAG: hypothetical protein WCA12_18425 [Burkholderiales bacterium]